MPPLPDIFGNYTLGEFVEVVAPAAIDWLPQTPGWYCVFGLLLLVLLRYSWRRLRSWHRNRYRREAVRRLQEVALGTAHGAILVDLNRLLKLTAMAAFSREHVAALSGARWVDFLNQQCTVPPFSVEHGRLLAEGTYSGARIETTSSRELLAAARLWILTHENSQHV